MTSISYLLWKIASSR